jgi:hypothetical protein
MDKLRALYPASPPRQTNAIVCLPAPESDDEQYSRWHAARRWCEQNCAAPWSAHTEYELGQIVYGFESEIDATHFSLAFAQS